MPISARTSPADDRENPGRRRARKGAAVDGTAHVLMTEPGPESALDIPPVCQVTDAVARVVPQGLRA
jgi:hypothetical protein